MLDEAITQLGTEDRMAILLRFFEQCDFRTIGSALGSNEDAARMRVARALEKLHAILTHRGATLTVTALGTALASVTTAPAGLAGSVATTALASAAAGVGIPTTLFKMIAMTKLKTGIISAVICTGVAIPLVMQHRTQAKFQEENRSLRQQMAQVASENERLSNLVMQVKSSQPVSQDQLNELLRLRGEVGVLMRQLAEKAKIQPSRQAIRSEQTVEQEEQPTPSQQLGIAKMNYAKHWVLAFQEYAQKNQGQMPAHFDHAGSFLSKNAPEETPSTTSQLEIVYQGSLIDLTNRQYIIVIREKEAWQSADGGWRRTYGFADGHAEIHHESTEGDLQAWEAQHLKLPSVPRQ